MRTVHSTPRNVIFHMTQRQDVLTEGTIRGVMSTSLEAVIIQVIKEASSKKMKAFSLASRQPARGVEQPTPTVPLKAKGLA